MAEAKDVTTAEKVQVEETPKTKWDVVNSHGRTHYNEEYDLKNSNER